VTSVKDQGQCGGCYAFSSVTALEGAYKIKHGELIEFSEQQYVDCSGRYGNMGCNGGMMSNCFEYLKTKRAMLRDDYPYTGKAGRCQYDSKKGVMKVKDHGEVPSENPEALMEAVNRQPISIAITSAKPVFYLYESGVLDDDTCGTEVDHAVTLIGYGIDQATGVDYWLIKNSWGTRWGENGYVRVKRDS
jgi:C1A family cysteine protease